MLCYKLKDSLPIKNLGLN